MTRYSVLLEREAEDGGYTVTVPALPGIVTEGDSLDEALAMAREAIQLHVYGLLELQQRVPVEECPYELAAVDVETDRAALDAFWQREGVQPATARAED